jgi:hypothetical protein
VKNIKDFVRTGARVKDQAAILAAFLNENIKNLTGETISK